MFAQQDLIPHMEGLRRFAVRLTKDRNEADDLLQTTLLKALEKSDQFEDGTNLFRWTSKIMFNQFASSRRRRKFETQYDPENYLNQMKYEASQESAVDLHTVREAMKRLSKDSQKILMMVSACDMSYSEVASHLGVPVGTVRSRLNRARHQLQAAMDKAMKRKQSLHILGLSDAGHDLARVAA